MERVPFDHKKPVRGIIRQEPIEQGRAMKGALYRHIAKVEQPGENISFAMNGQVDSSSLGVGGSRIHHR